MMLAVLAAALVAPLGCAPSVPPAPTTVRRIAVLPPCDATGRPLAQGALVTTYAAPAEGLGTILASAAREELARQGFQIVDPRTVAAATAGRVPASPESAGEIVASGKLDATALFIRVRRWEFPYPTMRTNEIIAALDVMLVDAASRRIVWEVRRPTKPVPLHGELIGGQADTVAAQDVMSEVFAALGPR